MALPASAGVLVKAPSSSSVYYISGDKRYVFPNDQTYKSWYSDYAGVTNVTSEQLASLTLAGNVTYRPGKRLVKVQTDPKVYAVSKSGTLRWVTTEQVAAALYGPSWSQQIDDVPDVFFANYKVGDPISDVVQYSPTTELAADDSIDTDKMVAVPTPLPEPTTVIQPTPTAQPTPQTPTPPPPSPTPTPSPITSQLLPKRLNYGGAASWPNGNTYGDVNDSCNNCVVLITETPTTANIYLMENPMLRGGPVLDSYAAKNLRAISIYADDTLSTTHVFLFSHLGTDTAKKYLFIVDAADQSGTKYVQQFGGVDSNNTYLPGPFKWGENQTISWVSDYPSQYMKSNYYVDVPLTTVQVSTP